MRNVYEGGDAEIKQATLKVVRYLMDHSSGGREVIRTYWVEHVRNPEIKKIGNSLLNRRSNLSHKIVLRTRRSPD